MPISYKPVGSHERSNSNATSFCLYESDRLDHGKHIQPFLDFLSAGEWEGDLLVFIEKGMQIELPEVPGLRLFEIEGLSQFGRHFYRYVGSDPALGYEWVRFEGTDSPGRAALLNARYIAETENIPLISFFRGAANSFNPISGSCLVNRTALDSLWHYINNIRDDSRFGTWNVDEILLSDWFTAERLGIVFVCPNAVKNQSAKEWLLRRLGHGPKTIFLGLRKDLEIAAKK